MNQRTATAVLTVVIAAAGLTACGSGKDSQPEAKTPPAAAPSTPAAPETSSKPSAATEAPKGKGIQPKPDAATQAKYIAALTAIDPDIVNTKPDTAVDRGRNTCETIAEFPQWDPKQVDLTAQRFTSPNHPDGFGTAGRQDPRRGAHAPLPHVLSSLRTARRRRTVGPLACPELSEWPIRSDPIRDRDREQVRSLHGESKSRNGTRPVWFA